jgi:hypothetical protein
MYNKENDLKFLNFNFTICYFFYFLSFLDCALSGLLCALSLNSLPKINTSSVSQSVTYLQFGMRKLFIARLGSLFPSKECLCVFLFENTPCIAFSWKSWVHKHKNIDYIEFITRGLRIMMRNTRAPRCYSSRSRIIKGFVSERPKHFIWENESILSWDKWPLVFKFFEWKERFSS